MIPQTHDQLGDLPEDDLPEIIEPEQEEEEQFVINKDGKKEPVDFTKIIDKIKRLSSGLKHVDANEIIKQVISNFSNGCTTSDLDLQAMKAATNFPTHHQEYKALACRLFVDDLHRKTPKTFSGAMDKLDKWGSLAPDFAAFVAENAKVLDDLVVDSLDLEYNFMSLCTWAQIYLLKADGKLVERPQYTLMRVAVGLHYPRIHAPQCKCFTCLPHKKRKPTKAGPEPDFVHGKMTDKVLALIRSSYYRMAVDKAYIHASPTMFNIGTKCNQLSSCFLAQIEGDSVDGIYNTLKTDAKISQSGGGIGNHVSLIRAAGSRIVTTNGKSNGLVPMLKVYNDTARYMDQCCLPGTTVYSGAGPKPIEQVVVGDRVLSEDGTYQPVLQCVRHEINSQVLEFTVKDGLEPVTFTPEHQILALRNPHNIKERYMHGRLKNGSIGFEYMDAKDLSRNDYLVFPVPQEVVDTELMNQDDCRMYGLLASCGGMNERNAWVSIPTNQKDTLDFVYAYCRQNGLHPHNHSLRTGFTTVGWSVASPRFKFSDVHMYGARGERIIHQTFANLPPEKTRQFLRGFVEGAGHFADEQLVIKTGSSEQVEQLRYQFLRSGILSSGEKRGEHSFLSVPITKDLLGTLPFFPWRHTEKLQNIFRYEDHLLTKIKRISPSSYKGIVYDFEVAKTHTYTTHVGTCHNGGGKRKGAFAIYIEPWHPDFLDAIEMRLPEGDDNVRARDLFFAVWNNDVFMNRLEQSQSGKNKVNWSFFCPKDVPKLFTTYGDEFKAAYEEAEKAGKARKTMDIWDVWSRVLFVEQKTGIPYMMYKDTVNRRNNQHHIGIVKGSNLCTEIVEYTDENEVAVCNLANIPLTTCLYRNKDGTFSFDFDKLVDIADEIVYNLNEVIDRTRYPVPQARYSNLRHRPIGLGVQGLANVFLRMDLPFTSVAAQELNHRIFEAIYYGALRGSCKLAERDGPYETYQGSKVSQGILCFDECKRPEIFNDQVFPPSEGYYNSYNPDGSVRTYLDWAPLRERISKFGIRNSLLVAPMPTASTAKILGNNESFEPYTSNIIELQTLAGPNESVNPEMVSKFQARGIWTAEMFEKIVAAGGSVQKIDEVPQDLKELCKTVWELSVKTILLMAHARGLFIDQSQSFNVYLADVNNLTAVHLLGWKLGLKTGQYYLHTQTKGTNMQIQQTTSSNRKRPISESKSLEKKKTTTDAPKKRRTSTPESKILEKKTTTDAPKKRSRNEQEEQRSPKKPKETGVDENGEVTYCTMEAGCLSCQ